MPAQSKHLETFIAIQWSNFISLKYSNTYFYMSLLFFFIFLAIYFLLYFSDLRFKKKKISGCMKDKITGLPFKDLELYTKNRYGLSSFLA